jgi:ubiquinone/menaquinone biosynthesis C-methylase UbiE
MSQAMRETEDDFWAENLERNLSDKRYWRRRDNVLRYLRGVFGSGSYLLNVGCGIGAFSYYVEQEFGEARPVSLDMSSNSLKTGKKQYNLSLPVKANALCLPFRDRTFDVILMMEIIEHIREQEQFLSEASRAVKDGGYLIVTTSPIKSDIFYTMAYWIKGKELFGFSKRRASREHVAEQHPEQLKKNLEKTGFKVLKMKYWNVLHLLSIPQLMRIPHLSSLIVMIDDRLGFLSRLCTDVACVAKKIEK